MLVISLIMYLQQTVMTCYCFLMVSEETCLAAFCSLAGLHIKIPLHETDGKREKKEGEALVIQYFQR